MSIRNGRKRERIIGDSPASCGFIWDGTRRGWYRPFGKDDMFTPYGKRHEWDAYAPIGRSNGYKGTVTA